MIVAKGRKVRRGRRGTTTAVVGVLIVVLLGFLAMAYDLGRTAVVRTELQNAADAAAMAGAAALGTDNLLVTNPAQAADAVSAAALAQKFAQANYYDLNGSRSVVFNTATDLTVGLLSTPGTLSQSLATASSATAFNSIQATAKVDATHGASLVYLFAPVLKQYKTDVQATSTATVQLYSVASMKALSGLRSPILPITMSLSDWQQMVNGQTGQDAYHYDPTTGTIAVGSDGLQEQTLYPGSNASSSNNGLIQFGTGSHSNAVLKDQVVNGPTYDQMVAQWPPSGVPPWSVSHTFTIGADPGWRATTFDDLATVAAAGLPRLIPINDGTNPGNGANGSYTIVAFAPVRVVASNKGGKSGGSAQVQAAVMIDPTVVASTTTLAPPGQGGVPVVRLSR